MRRLLAIALAACAANVHALTGIVTHVTDGDTVWVLPDSAAPSQPRAAIKLRLLGIDAPERCQPWGHQATAALTSRVLHRQVTFDSRARDDYNRLLGTLFAGGEDVGAWMVLHGHAWSYHGRFNAGPYAPQEREARAARRGLFRAADAIEPRVFRKRHGPCIE